MRKETEDKCAQAYQLILAGQKVESACNQVKIHTASYYSWRKIHAKTPGKPVKRRKSPKLVTLHLPTLAPSPDRAFIVFGSPQVLADFAKAYS